LQRRLLDQRLRKLLVAHVSAIGQQMPDVKELVLERIPLDMRDEFAAAVDARMAHAPPQAGRKRRASELCDAAPQPAGDNLAMADVGSIWDGIVKDVAAVADPRGHVAGELGRFIRFATTFHSQIAAVPIPFASLPCGDIAVGEHAALLYLSWVRYHEGTTATCTGKPVGIRELRRVIARIRVACSEYHHMVPLPACLLPDAPYGRAWKTALARWDREDSATYAKPAQEQVYLSGSDIEQYLISKIALALSGGAPISDEDIIGMFIMRVQSGTNLRAGNLEETMKWGDFKPHAKHGYYGSLVVSNTKRVDRSGGGRVRTKVERYVDDDVTGWIATEYHKRFAEGRGSEDYLFPSVARGKVDWQRPLANKKHIEMIRKCVDVLGLAPDGKLDLYNTTSIRSTSKLTEAYGRLHTKHCLSHIRIQKHTDPS